MSLPVEPTVSKKKVVVKKKIIKPPVIEEQPPTPAQSVDIEIKLQDVLNIYQPYQINQST